MGKWIGVDLDGTLAEYIAGSSYDPPGKLIERMAIRVRSWMTKGIEIRIFTARVCSQHSPEDIERIRGLIQDWTEQHFGVRFLVTAEKDYEMIELWDDRAIQVEPNTGRTVADLLTKEERLPPFSAYVVYDSKSQSVGVRGRSGSNAVTE